MVNDSNSLMNLAAEREILGAIMEDSAIFGAVMSEGLAADDFALSDHRRVFETMLDMSEAGESVDCITLLDRLGNSDGDAALVSDLIIGVVLVRDHVLAYVRILRKRKALRDLIQLGEFLQEAAMAPRADPEAIQSEVLMRLTTEKTQ